MKHPAPVMALLRRTQKREREQRERLCDNARYIASLERSLGRQTRRADQWRRTALELAAKVGPQAMDGCLLQVQWDEIQDLPEVEAG